MTGADRDVIKSKLDHSDVRIVHIKKLDTGGWRIDIEYSSSREDLKGLVGKEFDVQAAMPSEAGGVYAMLRPNVNEF